MRDWHWIPSKDNVADDATKLDKNANFGANGRWFSGPNILLQSELEWPDQTYEVETMEEVKSMHLHTIPIEKALHILIDPNRFSSWMKLLRSQAYFLRFIYNCHGEGRRSINGRKIGPINSEEYKTTEQQLLRQAQADGFLEEIKILELNQKNPRSRRISIIVVQ